MIPQAVPLAEFNRRLAGAVKATPGLSGVWVVAETSDVRVSGGHCYMELIDKDADGTAVARLRAIIWSSRFGTLNEFFRSATGSPLVSDIRVMVCLTASFHPLYGMSATITDINPEFTLGDVQRRRREMIERLRRQGILDLNRNLPRPTVPQNVAVISARGAAGYGDFVNQLLCNRHHLRFSVTLFEAVMQGERAAASIIDALGRVAASESDFDCVVIIRGGGATGDLAAFDNYDLAANIAMFPLPVIIGIGHERDITLLDYVANMRVKTPTAAAEWLINCGAAALENLRGLGADILDAARAAVARAHRRLDIDAERLATLPVAVLERQRLKTGSEAVATIAAAVRNTLNRNADHLKSLTTLLDTLSPQATLRRGFSITRAGGRCLTDADSLAPGTVLETVLARGKITSTVTDTTKSSL